MYEGILRIQVGKSGVTDSLIEEIKSQLGKGKKVRVRMLRSARGDRDRKEIADEVAGKTGARLVQVRGNTFILEGSNLSL